MAMASSAISGIVRKAWSRPVRQEKRCRVEGRMGPLSQQSRSSACAGLLLLRLALLLLDFRDICYGFPRFRLAVAITWRCIADVDHFAWDEGSCRGLLSTV